MSEYFTFAGASFVAVLSSNDTPHWYPKLEATDRPLIGTDRFERSIRSRQWLLELDLWVEPDDTAPASFLALQTAYAMGTVAGLVLPGDPAPDPVDALLVTFDVTPVRNGIDGYRGKAI
ncbi:MAG: hypothetical protein HGA45_44095, partial [Chloroflexales bacterium]|nr:hypothetical protein [Chloroflexales bacterium]